jgi:hypothetical protein
LETVATGDSHVSHVQVTADRTSEEGRDGVASEVAMAIGEASDEEDETPVGRVTGHAGERQGSEVAGGTKRKLDQDDGEEGETHLMPTTKASPGTGLTSPPKKMPRSTRSYGRGGVVEDRTRKTRTTPTPSSSAKQEQQALRFQVSSLADELSRKMQFLHVSIEGLADMQILHVQVKTRISDWEEGGLDTKFLLTKLKQASEDLQSYEEDAAPKGWRFLWDRLTFSGDFVELCVELC